MALKLRRKLSESGRSLVLRIPRDIERILNMKNGDEADLWVEDDKIVIKSVECL
jgi:antitoxin component of MazEF toxin-antitoxin module